MRVVFCLLVCWLAYSTPTRATELKAATAQAFDRYVKLSEERMNRELEDRERFLWIERQDRAARDRAYAQLRKGEVVIARLETRDEGRPIDAPDGLIHHWVGTVLIPGVTLDRTVAMMQDYARYPEIYNPTIRRAKTLKRDGNRFIVTMQLFMKKVISVVVNADYDVLYSRIDDRRQQVRSRTTRIAEVEQPGTANESEKPVGNDSGFLWRFNNYCSLREDTEGTLMECESISLSRDIPTGLGWLIGPFVTGIPRESMSFVLTSARQWLTNTKTVLKRPFLKDRA